MKKAKIITFANQKGGVGKTTILINLAVSFANANQKVLIIDTDQQGSVLDWKELQDEHANLNIDVLTTTDIVKYVKENTSKYDFIFIDSQGKMQQNELKNITVSDLVIIPLELNQINLSAVAETAHFANKLKDEKKIKAYFLLNKVLVQTKTTSDTFKGFKSALDDYGLDTLDSYIGNRSVYANSYAIGSVFDTDNYQAKNEILNLKNEIMEIL